MLPRARTEIHCTRADARRSGMRIMLPAAGRPRQRAKGRIKTRPCRAVFRIDNRGSGQTAAALIPAAQAFA
jgi:hypothetical protein